MLWLWHFLYSVGPHPVSILHIYTFVVLRALMADAASQAGDADSSRGTWSYLWFAGVRECPSWCSIVGATVTVHQFFCILHFCHTCSLCRVELVVQFPARGSTQVLLCLFPGVLWLWHFLYSVGPHPVPSLHIYTSVVLRAGAASQAGDSSWASGLTSCLQGSVNVHRGALLLVPQWQCISSFVFYICLLTANTIPYTAKHSVLDFQRTELISTT